MDKSQQSYHDNQNQNHLYSRTKDIPKEIFKQSSLNPLFHSLCLRRNRLHEMKLYKIYDGRHKLRHGKGEQNNSRKHPLQTATSIHPPTTQIRLFFQCKRFSFRHENVVLVLVYCLQVDVIKSCQSGSENFVCQIETG